MDRERVLQYSLYSTMNKMTRIRCIICMSVAVIMTATASSYNAADAQSHECCSFKRDRIERGMNHYLFEGFDDISGAQQTVNVLKVDLDSRKFKVVFNYGSDSTSSVAARRGAVAAINATYEPDATYIRVDGKNHHEVSIPSDHLRFWKHNGAITCDTEGQVRIINGAPGQENTREGWIKAQELYKSLPDANLFSGAPMLIDDYDPVGTRFVPDSLIGSDFKGIKYEDYRRHQGIRHPRTAVALTAENEFLMIVADGRNEKAAGMTARELTLFLAKHFNPRWALNLDGGGSATMVIKGLGAPETNVVNHPHDNHKFDHYGQRRICTHILVMKN